MNNTSAFMEYWGRAWADYCAAHWLHVHRRKQFTILQLVQLSSVKSSLSFTPYDVYSSQSTLLVGGRYKPATRMLLPCQRCRATAQRRTEAVAACSSSLYTDSVNTASQLKSLYQELQLYLILVLLGGSFLVIAQQWALSSNVHVRYVLLIE